MSLPTAPAVYWFQVAGTAAAVSSATFPIPRGCKITSTSAFSFGLSSSITHNTGAATDGYYCPANVEVTIDPAFCNDLSKLYLVAAGTSNTWLRYSAAAP